MVSDIYRWLITLLVGPIKADFQLTDTQMGLLLGLAFTVIHVLLAIPLGRTVDRSNRRNLILICGLLWSMCRSEEHTSELQSLMRISYAVFCLKKKKKIYIEQVLNEH